MVEGDRLEEATRAFEGSEKQAGRRVPDPHRPIVPGGGDETVIIAEGHAPGEADVAGHRFADRLSGRRVPEPHRAVVPGGGEEPAVAAVGDAVHRPTVTAVGAHGAAGLIGCRRNASKRAAVASGEGVVVRALLSAARTRASAGFSSWTTRP